MIKNNKKTMKNIVFSLVLAALMLTAKGLSAQNADNRGLFGRGKSSADYSYSGGESFMRKEGSAINDGGISNYGIGETVPLGSGLVLLLGASIGYVALKKKEDEQ